MKALAIRSEKKRPRKAQSTEYESRLIIHAIPSWAYADPDLLRCQIDYWLLMFFKHFLMGQARSLPAADYTYLASLSPEELGGQIVRDANRVARREDVAHPPLIDDFSKFVLLQAETPIGFRLDLSPHVSALKRIWEWENRGMFTRYGEACDCGARVAARTQFASLDLQAENALKKAALMEMNALREKLCNVFPDPLAISPEEVSAQIAVEIARTLSAYPILRWCHERAQEYGPLYPREAVKQQILPKPPSSDYFWDAWRSRQTGQSQERIHKLISSGNFPQANE